MYVKAIPPQYRNLGFQEKCVLFHVAVLCLFLDYISTWLNSSFNWKEDLLFVQHATFTHTTKNSL